ncbi:nose resistant to fluoxetine protein 6-like [Armigeres subalbatus]|uniref:nose resistant to fluoxetine protein 6-like n=1 Tax=Armigeres subalbatus TaxID=124917 RepID=UPI002ED225D7
MDVRALLFNIALKVSCGEPVVTPGNFSKDELHYDHTLLERGICIPDCEHSLRLSGELQELENLTPLDLYSRLARSCINTRLKHRYDLEIGSYVQIYHCYTPEQEDRPIDYLEWLFYAIMIALAIFIVASTVYDTRLRSALKCPDTHYDQDLKSRKERLLASFSFPRNICRLKNLGSSKIRLDLQFLEAFRFIHMCRVVFLHATMAHIKVPQANTDYMERLHETPLLIFFVAEFQNYIQTFLSISGMLLAINFLEHIRKNPDFNLSIFWDKLKGRLYRIVPAYAFMILVECAIIHRYYDGPIGQQYIGEAEQNCRHWWWTNLLFINNYIRTDQPCLIQSWYLAVDMQLFIYGLIAMMAIWRWPWTRKYIFAGAFVCAVLVPTLTTYFKDIEPAMTNRIKNFNRYNREHNYHYDIYFPFHQNIGVYTFGMLAGFIYHRYRDSPEKVISSKWFRIIFWVSVVYYFSCMVSVPWVLMYRDQIQPVLKAIYSTLFKHSWAVMTTVLQLGLALAPAKYVWKKFLSHSFFGVAGKLCYGLYLIHFTVIEVVYSGVKAPEYTNERGVSKWAAQIFWWTVFFGPPLTLFVELPSGAALKELLDRRKCSNKVHDIQQTQTTVEQRVEQGGCHQ